MKNDRTVKLAFFDVDGTLSVPVFHDKNGCEIIGFPAREWDEWCEKMGDEAYAFCRSVEPVRRYALRLKEQGARLFVLTTSYGEQETKAKERFIGRCYPGLFERLIAVSEDDEKIKVIVDMAEKEGITPGECELVEDTYRILLEALVPGIKGTHITHILDMLGREKKGGS